MARCKFTISWSERVTWTLSPNEHTKTDMLRRGFSSFLNTDDSFLRVLAPIIVEVTLYILVRYTRVLFYFDTPLRGCLFSRRIWSIANANPGNAYAIQKMVCEINLASITGAVRIISFDKYNVWWTTALLPT